jgi:hypothetical protein
MMRAARISVAFLLLTNLLLMSMSLSSCAKKDTSKLAQDLIAAGFVPMEPFKPRSGEQTMTSPSNRGSSVLYANFFVYLDQQGRVCGLLANPPHSNPYVHLTAVVIKTYKGNELFSLTRKEVVSLYGIQQGDKDKLATMYRGQCLGYIYRFKDSGYVNVLIGFDGIGDSSKVNSVQADYAAIPAEWDAKTGNYYDWPKM